MGVNTMTTKIELLGVEEHEDGSMTVSLDMDEEGKNLLLKEGLMVITFCGIYKVDLDEVGKAIELYSRQLNRDKQLMEALDEMYEYATSDKG
jgi:hypothetical protein